MSKQKKQETNIALQNFNKAYQTLNQHPMFAGLMRLTRFNRNPNSHFPADGWATIAQTGLINVHPTRRGSPDEWIYIIAHCLLHLGMEHFQEKEDPTLWNIACDCVVARFLQDMKIGNPPYDMGGDVPAVYDEEKLYKMFLNTGVPNDYKSFTTFTANSKDMIFIDLPEEEAERLNKDASRQFAYGLGNAVKSAVNVAAGYQENISSSTIKNSVAINAHNTLINTYPLLGALAASFKIIENVQTCHRIEVSIAAVSAELQEIYINPSAGLDHAENMFVMAHELLHVALCHDSRCQWRDHYLWNVACDFVINSWLKEMTIGEMPHSALYDPELKGLSAEAVYERITQDLRTYRKLNTLRGYGMGDMITENTDWRQTPDGTNLDDFYRRALAQGLTYHQEEGRGYIPAGLIEEIKALAHPPIAWDVELAQWFDEMFTPIDKKRTYARPSRRQSSTPDIPRPSWQKDEQLYKNRTFGVVLDTSGSMDRKILGKALGAIASYSQSRDVPATRVVFCDADAYDQGYMKPEDIAEQVKVKGRGGTILQPGIDLLLKAKDFPKTAPILIITDAGCDRLTLFGREHAYLIPVGAKLPFIPKGKIFIMR